MDLVASEIRRSESKLAIQFQIKPFRRHCLLHGLDDVGITVEKLGDITEFEKNRRKKFPWIDDIPSFSISEFQRQNSNYDW